MAITLTATVGGATSNTYVTLSEAEAYMQTRLHDSVWVSSSDETKRVVLVWATKVLDKEDWLGDIVGTTQALRWPRSGVSDLDGNTISSLVLPQFLKDATVEQAFALLQGDLTVNSSDSNLKSVKVDAIEIEYFTAQGSYIPSVPKAVTSLIGPFLISGGSSFTVRTVRS